MTISSNRVISTVVHLLQKEFKDRCTIYTHKVGFDINPNVSIRFINTEYEFNMSELISNVDKIYDTIIKIKRIKRIKLWK